ncbi:hypothetical protein M2222_001251 [Bradyrhizobium elkanii]|uniref:hypothetical protein n=1 Tax=Bradyrhizobium elkanii TaxID=29448 RepID=UPI0021680EDC|nr:hypothetical protein [Bradyrhizobium elkanii]MCS3449926.1 hypothetical protein [Bradyrhizobium elkanii]MCS3558929.1 hypothetical protein [Bradyrhizobium elkanii]MCW2151223.1 hypothetical protein [Bradyrhizobium elkanii]MCW2374954.1 hypothetical protein [Bradyrhizobium elkanii]
MTRLAIRVSHQPNGTSTVSGIPTRNVRDLFNLASNQLYGLEKAHKKSPTDPDLNDPWLKVMRVIIDQGSHIPRYRHGYEDMPVMQLDKIGRALRFRAVRELRESRLRVAEVMDMILASYKQRRQP